LALLPAAVMVEHDPQSDLAGVVDDLVHDLQAVETLQVGVFREVDAVGGAARIEQLIGVGQSNGVEALLLHLVHHRL
jgi:hypothetical protein